MAERRYPVRLMTAGAGTAALRVLLLLPLAAAVAGILPLAWLGLKGETAPLDSYVLRILQFTLTQAGLSAILSLALGIPAARALARQEFPGRNWLVRLLAVPQALPAIVAVLGIVEIFGANGIAGGWVPLYGLAGILMAHVFFNAPLAARAGLSALEAVPPENLRLAAQLGFAPNEYWRHIDWPALRTTLPGIALLIFLLCAASFTIVLTLGGGPQATTLEVAIYQSLKFDFDPARAVLLALLQASLCAVLVILARSFRSPAVTTRPLIAIAARADGGGTVQRILDFAAILVLALLFMLPSAAIALAGLRNLTLPAQLAQAIITSLAIAAASSIIAMTLCWITAATAARSRPGANVAAITVLSALILPPAVIATGWFILLRSVGHLAMILVIALNALTALPFAYAILSPAWAAHAAAVDRLCAELDVQGFNRWRLIDLPALKRPAALALTMAAGVSLGDLTAVLMFGSGGLMTLPSLIYTQMASYRFESAGGTALILMLAAFALLALSDWLAPKS